MANFTWFTTFPIFYHQSVSFLEKSQKFSFLGGYINKCFEFFNLFESFHIKAPQNDPQWWILPPKWLRFAQNGQFWSFCRFFHLFCQNEAQIDLEWPISPDSQLFPSFTTKASHFWRNLKNFCFQWGGVHWHIFWSSSTFLNHFTLKQLKMTHNGKFCQKSGLDWLKMANFGHFAGFSIFSPKMRLRLTLNGHLIHNFSHLLPPKCLIFGEISKIFIPLGGYISKFFWVFQLLRIISHQSGSKWPTMAILPPKWRGWAQNGQFWFNFNKNLNISVESWLIFRTGLVFLSWSKWVQGVLCYDQNWWKLKYLSRISTDLHQTFRTGLIFLNQSKWVQGVLYYNQKWWKL